MKPARYRQIQEHVRAQIQAGVFAAGDRLPTELELAALHGVSRVTSAAALNALAREGLVQRTPRRGTIVSAVESLARPDARPLIGWIQPEIDPAFGLDVLRGLERAARTAGYNVLLLLTGYSREEEERAIRRAVAAGAGGVALFLQDGETYNGEVLRLFLDGFPLVLADRYLRGVACAVVQSDNVAGARDLVAELVAAGHRNICIAMHPPRHTSTIEDRLEGYSQALASGNIPLHRSLLYVEDRFDCADVGWHIPDEAIQRFEAYLRRKPEISAVFATNAPLALLTLHAAARLGRSIPEDLSVVSVDAVETYPLPLRRFTCALQQREEMGATAVRLLEEQIAGQPSRRVVLPMRLVRAESVVPPRTAVAEPVH